MVPLDMGIVGRNDGNMEFPWDAKGALLYRACL